MVGIARSGRGVRAKLYGLLSLFVVKTFPMAFAELE